MADFTITVYPDATNVSLGEPLQEIGLAVGAEVKSGVISGSARQPRRVRVATQVDCHFRVGESPTATADSAFLAAGGVEYIGMEAGWRVSVIAA